MLHIETVESGTLALLKELQQMEELTGFHLVGGTALALQFGHRKSIDLDLFGIDLKKTELIEILKSKFRDFQFVESGAEWGLFCFINGIKVDIIRYPHSLIFNPIISQGISMYDHRDLAAMKLNTLLKRGAKKDFWDIYELLNHLSLTEMIEFFQLKYPDQRLLISIPQALTYFEDAEQSPDPICFNGLQWQDVKAKIQREVRMFLA